MANSVRLTGDWKKLERQLSSDVFRAKITSEMKRATFINAGIVKREVRLNIRDGGHTPNAVLTRFIKGSSRPLIDQPGGLFQAIAFRSTGPFRAEIGVLKGDPAANIAFIVHQGATIPVTAKMRGMFAALQDASEGRREPGSLTGRARELYARQQKGWKALKPSTVAIRIAPRPFFRQAVENQELNNRVAENWLAAAASAVAGTPRAMLKPGPV